MNCLVAVINGFVLFSTGDKAVHTQSLTALIINSSYVSKISSISLVLLTRENADIFNTFDEIYLAFTSKK